MTRIKRNKAKKNQALTPPPPPPNAPEADSGLESDDETTDWKKLALGEDPEDIDSQVSPYQLEETLPASESDSPADDAARQDAVHEEIAENATDTTVETDTTDPESPAELETDPEAETEAKPVTENLSDSELDPHETETATITEDAAVPVVLPVSTPSEADKLAEKARLQAEKERQREEKARRREEKRAARAQARAEAKARRAELQTEYADLPEARRVKLQISRISPLSAAKIGFLVAVAFALVQLVAAGALWVVLDMLHVFSSMQGFLQALSATALVNLMDTLQFSRFIAMVALNGVLQILILTVLSWLAAVIYNLIARMVGGLHVVMTDD